MIDYLDQESSEHFQELKGLLDAAGVAYTVNPRLVRGLDYYSRTVFEWVTDALGSQGAVCSGAAVTTAWSRNWVAGPRQPWAGRWASSDSSRCLRHVAAKAPADDADVYVVAVGDRHAREKAFAIRGAAARPGGQTSRWN